MRRKALIAIVAVLAVFGSACSQQADVVSENISLAADNFEIQRRIVFYNGITDTYMLEVIGPCALGNFDNGRQRTVVCKTPDGFKKHFLGLSDNVTYFVEQIDAANVSDDFYRVRFRPQTVVPDIEIGG